MWIYTVIKGIFKKTMNKRNYKIWGILKTAHYKTLDYFFLYDGLAQAEEPGDIPVFPLSTTFVVYITSKSNMLVTEITSVLARPKTPHVTKEYSQSSKSTVIQPLVCLAGLYAWVMTPSSVVWRTAKERLVLPEWVLLAPQQAISPLQNTC